jgi:hypothetical protein
MIPSFSSLQALLLDLYWLKEDNVLSLHCLKQLDYELDTLFADLLWSMLYRHYLLICIQQVEKAQPD